MGEAALDLSFRLKELDTFNNLSPAAIELINKIDKPDTNIQEIIELVYLDRVLYASILKYSQSAALGLRRSPTTIEEAIPYLGLYGLRDLIYIINSKNIFKNLDSWYRSIFTAFCTKKLSQKLELNQKLSSDNYIAALLFDMGSNLLASRFSKEYQRINLIEKLNERYRIETLKFGIASSDISYELLANYNLSNSILEIIKTQSLDEESEYKQTNALIDLSYQLSFLELIDEKDLEEILDSPICKKFKLNHLNICSKSIRKLHIDVKEFISF